MRHFSFSFPVARHPLGVLSAALATVLIAPAGLLQRGVPRNVGTPPTAVDLAVVAVGANEHLGTARKARAKIESTNWFGIHRLAPCQADQEWTGRPTRWMGYLMHIPPTRGLQGAAPVKTCQVLGWRRPRLFCAAKAVLPHLHSKPLAPERTSPPSSPSKPDSLRQPRHFAASGARHAFGGIRSCRTKSCPARATAPAPTAELRHTAGEDRSMALELRFGLPTSGLAARGQEGYRS